MGAESGNEEKESEWESGNEGESGVSKREWE